MRSIQGNIIESLHIIRDSQIIIQESINWRDDFISNDSYQNSKEFQDIWKENRKAFEKYFIPLLSDDTLENDLKEAINNASLKIPYHDLSKYEPVEFNGYRMHFYPTEFEKNDPTFKERSQKAYDVAWEHHHKHHPHHPQHWKNRDMPYEYIVEMLCDWLAMSMKFGQSTLDWYEKEADEEKGCFSEKTKKIVEYLLYNKLSFRKEE